MKQPAIAPTRRSSSASAPAAPAPELSSFGADGYRLLFESMRDCSVLAIGLAGHITLYGPGAERIFGYTPQEILGAHISVFYKSEDVLAGHPQEELRIALAQGQYQEQGWRVRKNGEVFWADVVIQPILSDRGDTVGFTKMTRDLTSAMFEETKYRRLFESACEAFLVVESSGAITLANRQAETLFGYSRSEMIGMKVEALMPERFRGHHPDLRTALVRGDVFPLKDKETRRLMGPDLRLYGRKKSGEEFPVEISLSALDSSAGGLVTCSITDISQRVSQQETLYEREAQLRNIFENSPIGMTMHTPDGAYIRVNKAAVDFFGYSAEELKRMSFHDVTHPDDLSETLKNFERMKQGLVESYKIEKRYRHKDGRAVWGLVGVSSVRDDNGELCFIVAQIMDITAQKLASELITSQAADLRRSNDDLQQFANIASHDLQEPLRTITSFVQLVNKRYADTLDDDGKQWIGYIVEATLRMQNLINDLLAYSRVGSRTKAPTAIPLASLIQAVLSDLKIALEQSGAKVSVSDMPTVMVDEVQIRQLIQNLIGNAIKYRGDKAPRIEIASSESDGYWTIGIKDNGIGIEPQYFERVFMIFQRLHTRAAYPGTGVGLAICKRIVERHGGRIWVESTPGAGTTFSFTLPKAIEA